MPETKFIFDRMEKETQETIDEILAVVQKKPYPDASTTHLASFIHAMFQAGSGIKTAEPKKMPLPEQIFQKPVMKPMPVQPKPIQVVQPPKQAIIPMPVPVMPQATAYQPHALPVPETGLLAKEHTLLPGMPEAPPAVFKRKEYAINTFNTQVGVVMDNDDSGKPAYKIAEPAIKEEVLKQAKEYISSDFEKDFQILDNKDYMDKKIEKACRKNDVPFTDDYAKSIVYYLKRDLLGFRRIDALMYDNDVQAIYCEGLNKPVLVEIKDFGKMPTNIIFTDMIDMNALLYKIAKATGNELGDTKPILDTEFQGYRIQAVLGIGGMSSKLIIKK